MKNTEFGMVDDPYGPLDNSALGLPLATYKEAPAEAGSVSSEADLKRIVKDLIAHRRAGDYDLMADDVANCLWPLLRAQPQAREDAQPVHCHHEAYQGYCAHCGVKIVNGFAITPKPYPDPDALRVAVEALEPFAYFAKHGISREYINSDAPDDGLCAAASFPAGAYRGAVQAPAAMQAKK